MAESRTSTIFCEFRPTTITVKHFCDTELILIRIGLLFANSGDHAILLLILAALFAIIFDFIGVL